MLHILPNARTTPVTRAEIARSDEPSSVLARRYGVGHRPPASDASVVPRTASTALPARATCPGRRAGRSAPPSVPCGAQPASPPMIPPSSPTTSCRLSTTTASGAFCGPGSSTAGPDHRLTRPPGGRGCSATTISASCTSTSGICRSRTPAVASGAGAPYLVAMGRRSRSVHLAVKDDRTPRPTPSPSCARPSRPSLSASPTCVRTTTAASLRPSGTCAELGVRCRHARPRTPQANGMAERFSGRVAREGPGINVSSHRRRVLDGRAPDQIVTERLEAEPTPARAAPNDHAGPCDTTPGLVRILRNNSPRECPRCAVHCCVR